MSSCWARNSCRLKVTTIVRFTPNTALRARLTEARIAAGCAGGGLIRFGAHLPFPFLTIDSFGLPMMGVVKQEIAQLCAVYSPIRDRNWWASAEGLVGVRLRNVVWVGEKERRDLFIRGASNIHRAVSAVTWPIPIDLSRCDCHIRACAHRAGRGPGRITGKVE